MIVKNENDEDIEVFTKEELDEQLKSYVPVDEVKTLKEKLKGLEDKDYNFKQLREKEKEANKTAEQIAAEKEAELAEFRKKHEEDISGLRNEIKAKEINEEISKLTTDIEEAKKIKFYFEKLSAGDTEDKGKEHLLEAYQLVTKSPDIPNFLSASGAGAKPAPGDSEQKKAIAERFSITKQFTQK